MEVLVVRREQRVGGEPRPPEQELPVVEQEGDVAGLVEQDRGRGEQARRSAAASPGSATRQPAAPSARARPLPRLRHRLPPASIYGERLASGWLGRIGWACQAALERARMANMGPVADRRGPVRFPLMGTAIVTGSGGLIGSESVAPSSSRRASTWSGSRTTCAPVLRPRGLDLAGDRRADRRASTPSARTSSTSATPTASSGSSPSTPARSSSSSTPPRSRRTTGRRASRRPTSASTPTARSTCSRPRAQHCPDAPFIFTSTNKVYGDTPEPAAAARTWRRGSSCPRTHHYFDGHRHLDVDRPLDPLAVRRLEGGRRPAGAGVRALLRACRPSASAAAA